MSAYNANVILYPAMTGCICLFSYHIIFIRVIPKYMGSQLCKFLGRISALRYSLKKWALKLKGMYYYVIVRCDAKKSIKILMKILFNKKLSNFN